MRKRGVPGLRGMHHVALITANYPAARHFYTEVLGLPVVSEHHRVERQSWKLDLRLPDGAQLELFSFPEPPARLTQPEACGLRHLALRITDIEAAVAYFIQCGIVVEPVRVDELTGRRFTFLADPDGLPIELYEEPPEAPTRRDHDEITVLPVMADHPELRRLQQALVLELHQRFPDDAVAHLSPTAWHDAGGVLFVIWQHGQAVAFGGYQPMPPVSAELKYLYVSPLARGRGLAQKLLGILETHARERGIKRLVLVTAEDHTDAIALFRRRGYQLTSSFGGETVVAHRRCFAKLLAV